MSSLTLAVTGIREGQNIDYSKLSVELLPVPPAEEQAAIAKYLAHANSRIDNAIGAKRRLLALLEEQRRATTGRLVVGQGIHDDLSETGSKWFPTLPANWDVVQLGRVIQFAIDGPHFSPNYLDEGIPFRTDRWLLEDIKYVSERDFADFNRRVQPQQGDVLYTKGGTTGVARVVDLDFPFQIWVHVAVLRPRNWIVEPRYLALALNSPKCYEGSSNLSGVGWEQGCWWRTRTRV